MDIGLILSQLLKLNGASQVVIAANKGIKTQVAKDIHASDVVIELDRENPDPQWDQIKKDYPFGFDIVVSVSYSEPILFVPSNVLEGEMTPHSS